MSKQNIKKDQVENQVENEVEIKRQKDRKFVSLFKGLPISQLIARTIINVI